jgi:hypothetical protein
MSHRRPSRANFWHENNYLFTWFIANDPRAMTTTLHRALAHLGLRLNSGPRSRAALQRLEHVAGIAGIQLRRDVSSIRTTTASADMEIHGENLECR